VFSRILIANRGEIACRIIATCRRLGIETVAVYSDADVGARHVRLADQAVHIGPAAASESYLDAEEIIAVAGATGAEAVHPGYGFLAENAAFARACGEAGLVFIGPAAETIELMGSKIASKAAMQAAGVPVIPGYHGDDQSDAGLSRAAAEIGYPLMIKASAGGGGKGMRLVRDADAFQPSLDAARREARNAFGDDAMLLERYISAPRHIEFQVFGDQHGARVHLFERECSVQRRYQKIIEETPSPALDDALRTRMGAAALAAADAVAYINAGTVEFILGEAGEFYFMEMNTRLQVEHPVTEMVTGLDLVEWQLQVAAGGALPLGQQALRCHGHAIELRIYAEDPAQDFLPSVGRITRFVHPEEDAATRIERGVETGDEVSIHYDPMLAKIVVHGDDRADALARAARAAWGTLIAGPATNLGLLRRLLGDADLIAGRVHTAWLDAELPKLLAAQPAPADLLLAAALHVADQDAYELAPFGPWRADGWRSNDAGGVRLRIADAQCSQSGPRELTLRSRGEHHRLFEGSALLAETDEAELNFDLIRAADRLVVRGPQTVAAFQILPLVDASHSADDAAHHPGAPMPGRVVAVLVEAGQHVTPGDGLMVLEGMKMEVTVSATIAGRVSHLHKSVGDRVDADEPLVDIDDEGREDPAVIATGEDA
jgi:3-methylcrotonyl-CoA carboxylase alpha subunit